MKKIAIVTMGVALNGEKGYSRFRFISEFCVQHGYDVDLITSSFQHWEKRQRNASECLKVNYPFGLKFVYEPGYKKNIDLRRIYSHHIAAKNIKALLEEGHYDLVYSEIPPNDVAKSIAEYCEKKQIPFIVDVNDLWPEAMRMVADIPVLSDILFFPFLRDAEYVYSRVSGVIGTSDEYRDRPFKLSKRLNVPRETVYVGNEISVFDEGAKRNTKNVEKKEGEFWVTYAGTLGKSYDIKTLIKAGKELQIMGYKDIRIIILGGGPDEVMLKKLDKEIEAKTFFAGYQKYEVMAAYLTKSDILVNSFVKKAPQSIVTKIGDYLAAGKPMINTCSSREFRNKVEQECFGLNIEAENVEVLVQAILQLYQNKQLLSEYGKNARAIAEEQFDRKTAYVKILNMIQELIGA